MLQSSQTRKSSLDKARIQPNAMMRLNASVSHHFDGAINPAVA